MKPVEAVDRLTHAWSDVLLSSDTAAMDVESLGRLLALSQMMQEQVVQWTAQHPHSCTTERTLLDRLEEINQDASMRRN